MIAGDIGIRSGKASGLTYCALFSALMAVSAFIRIPTPAAPITLQAQTAVMAGILPGGRRGMKAMLIYAAMGLAGLPVFTGGGGLHYVVRPTFGYIVGFALAAYAAGGLAAAGKPDARRLLLASLAGLAIIYICGAAYYCFISAAYMGAPVGLWPLITGCVLPPLPGDIAMCAVGAALCGRLLPMRRVFGAR